MRSTKRKRLDAIKDVILKDRVASQEGLKKALEDNGIEISQATLSRDLQEMGVVKKKIETASYYTIPVNKYKTNPGSTAFKSIELCGNIAVVKTLPGHASMLALLLDSKNLPEVAGSVAGDDTIFVLVRPNISTEQCIRAITDVIA